VKRLVEMHEGTVEVESGGEGQGSCFRVTLPRVHSSPFAQSVRGGAPKQKHGLRILVVDDNLDAAQSLARMLQLMGNETMTAHDGLEAINCFGEFGPHVVLLDLGMPRMNGYETARQLRERVSDTPVTIVALTGWGKEEDRRKSESAGFDAHLVKPVDRSVLETLLTSVAQSSF
jgi:CheY-like chemotaxis protein